MGTVLVVDHDVKFLESACDCLYNHNAVRMVRTVQSGADVIQQVEIVKPDIVCISVSMPGISGIKAARKIKGMENPPYVVMLADRNSIIQRCHATAAGVNAFIQKNQFCQEIFSILDAFMESRNMEHGSSLADKQGGKYRPCAVS